VDTHGTLNHGRVGRTDRGHPSYPREEFWRLSEFRVCTRSALVLFRFKTGVIPMLLGCSLAGIVSCSFSARFGEMAIVTVFPATQRMRIQNPAPFLNPGVAGRRKVRLRSRNGPIAALESLN
jgi:hypothetical protein